MSESRVGYNGTRILIEAERVLDSSFAAQGLYLSGAQIEMLRNITHYLNRRSTFVDEYREGYYLMPDDTDWDAIQAIIADMEDKLMAAENTLWGFNDGFVRNLAYEAPGDGTATLNCDEVPEGELLVLQTISWINITAQRGTMQILIKRDAMSCVLKVGLAQPQALALCWSGKVTLEEDDRIIVKQAGCLTGDAFVGAAWGYRMKVPG